jgi:hypothetical protein
MLSRISFAARAPSAVATTITSELYGLFAATFWVSPGRRNLRVYSLQARCHSFNLLFLFRQFGLKILLLVCDRGL